MDRRIRVEWVGGPLDGCVELFDDVPGPGWQGPDVSDPSKVIVYLLGVGSADSNERRYVYNQRMTDLVNARREGGL